MTLLQERSKVSQAKNIDKETLFAARTEKVEMTLNTDSALAQSLLIQRLTELYEDPIEATVRETVSNAIDAVSVATSGDVPEVHIYQPTPLNPVFIVKDNGVGMTYEDLKNVYSKYGASTKADDLEQIGAYGLGAKAPLSYGTEFTVTSVKDGEKTTVMVAREEMTNFIKIVESKETDEPTGTTVSIPLKTKDISKFVSNVERYENTPLDKDVNLYINDELVFAEGYTLLSDKVVTYNGPEIVTGRVWVKTESIIELLSAVNITNLKNSFKYVIGGWKYSAPSSRGDYYRKDYGIVVELKAGIVGFNSARDAILANDKYDELEALLVNYVGSNDFVNDTTKMISNLEIEEFKFQISTLMEKNRRALVLEDGKMKFKSDKGSFSSIHSIERNFSLDKFVHAETGFKFDDVLKNIPTSEKSTVILNESKSFDSKTAQNYLFDKDTSFSMFEIVKVSEINEYMEKVFKDGEIGHDFYAFMMNLSISAFTKSKSVKKRPLLLTFVTDINDEEVSRKLKTGRKTIFNMSSGKENNNYSSTLVYTSHSKKDIEKMLEGLGIENTMSVEITSSEDMLEKMKKYRKENKKTIEQKQVPIGLGTDLYKFLPSENYTERAKAYAINKERINLIIVSKNHGVRISNIIKIRDWFCNTNRIKTEDLDMYISCGTHKTSDVEFITNITEHYYMLPSSDKAGLSKAYFTKIHNRKAGLHGFNKETIKGSQEFLIKIVMGLSAKSPEILASEIEHTILKAIKLSEITGTTKPTLPTEALKSILEYSKKDDNLSKGRYYDWGLSNDELTELIPYISDTQLELAQNLSLLVGETTLIKKSDGNIVRSRASSAYSKIDTDTIKRAYEGEELTKQMTAYVKSSTEAYLEMLCEISKSLEKEDFSKLN